MMRLAVALTALIATYGSFAASTASDSATDPQENPNGLSEIIVTAQKRDENLEKVPAPVSVVTADTLMDLNQLRFEDFFSDFPGLSFSTGNRGEIFPSIRGVTTGEYTPPTVGTIIDGVPVGSSTIALSAPEVDPSDLKQIEVLRGPQGTLYGSTSIGGLIKYETVDPSTTALTGRVEAGAMSTYNGAGPGYLGRAAVNLPLSDTLALRVSGYLRQDPGYIDDAVNGMRGVNEDWSKGGHAALLWQPMEDFSLKLSALFQHSWSNGTSNVTSPPLPDLQENYLPGVGGYDRELGVYSATIKGKVDGVDITSITGYNAIRMNSSTDYSAYFGSYFLPLFGVSGVEYSESLPVDKLSEEFRVSQSGNPLMDWVGGLYYTQERYHGTFTWPAINPANGATVGSWGGGEIPRKYEEYAAFMSLTFHITDRFDLEVGARQSHDQQGEYATTYYGGYAAAFYGANPFTQQTLSESENPFTYLFSPSFKISPDSMIYARLSSGFEPGGPNSAVAVIAGGEPTFGPSRTFDYELGSKTLFFSQRLSIDLSLYYIDWRDIQESLESNGASYTVNAGTAKSQGIEFQFSARPFPDLNISGWATWGEALLTTLPPPSTGIKTDILPDSSRASANLDAEQLFPVFGNVQGFVGGMVSYIGRRWNDAANPIPFGGYMRADLRTGLKFDGWKVNIFADNVTDKRGQLGGGPGTAPGGYVLIQPRTVGIAASKSF